MIRRDKSAQSGEGADDATGGGQLPADQKPGQIYAFRTRPFSEFAPRHTDRFAAFKLIGISDEVLVVAVLDGIWAAPPKMADAQAAGILTSYRFGENGKPAVFGVNRTWWQPAKELDSPRYLGLVPVTAEEQALADIVTEFRVGSSFAALSYASVHAEGEWRWANDRDNLISERDQMIWKLDAERLARDLRYRTRLRGLTWDQLLSETPFARWTPSPPFPSADFTEAARKTIHDACRALQALGAKPRKADVRAILKQTVLWFNAADEAAGGVIETEEREDIYAILEEMAHVARQKALADEVDQWRDW